MIKIDKRDERKQAAKEEARRKGKEREEKEAKEKEQVEFFAEFHTDWRCDAEFVHAEEPQECIFPYRERRRRFLTRAIENRNKLNSIIIEPHENHRFGHQEYWLRDLIKVPIEEAIYFQLKEEAENLGLNLEEYIRGIYYTAAYEKHQKKLEAERLYEEASYRNRTPMVKGFIPADIRQKLEETYGNPEIVGCKFGSYFDELMQLAREHFNL